MNKNEEGEEIEDEIYEYQLVEFVKLGRKGQRQVDIVPSFWAQYNIKKAREIQMFRSKSFVIGSFFRTIISGILLLNFERGPRISSLVTVLI